MKISLIALLSLSILQAAAPALADQETDNKMVVEGMVAAVNARDFDSLGRFLADDVRRHSSATPDVVVKSLEDMKAFLEQDLAACPDATIEIEIILADEDKVALLATYRGTQTGAMGPFPPSGKRVESPFMSILRLDGGKIVEMWVEWDNINILTQLGHFPPPHQK